MLKKSLQYSALLIGGYLVLNKYTGAKTVIDSSTAGAGNLVQRFQGR